MFIYLHTVLFLYFFFCFYSIILQKNNLLPVTQMKSCEPYFKTATHILFGFSVTFSILFCYLAFVAIQKTKVLLLPFGGS